MKIEVKQVKKSKLEKTDLSKLAFGKIFSDHMLRMSYKKGKWNTPEIVPFGPMRILPSLTTLHYGQSIFEGMKAFHVKDGSINVFRPDKHFDRLNKSAHRLCIPAIDKRILMDCLTELLRLDRKWIPTQKGYSLYIRPFTYAADPEIGAHVSDTYQFMIILSPVGAYYKEGFDPVKLMTTLDHARSVEGGVGYTKTSGNYAASLYAAHEAQKKGFTQVLWLDGVHRNYVEEVGTMNVFFLIKDELITPHLSGTILAGVTRDSVLHLAKEWGMNVSERKISMDEVIAAADDGNLKEVFGTGTAAVISPVGLIHHKEKDIIINNGKTGDLSRKLFDAITGIQCGDKPDKSAGVIILNNNSTTLLTPFVITFERGILDTET